MQIEGKIEEKITTSKSFQGKITLQRNEYRDLIRLTITGHCYNYPESDRQSIIDHALALEEECLNNHATEEQLRNKINPVVEVSLQIKNKHGTYDNYGSWFKVVSSIE